MNKLLSLLLVFVFVATGYAQNPTVVKAQGNLTNYNGKTTGEVKIDVKTDVSFTNLSLTSPLLGGKDFSKSIAIKDGANLRGLIGYYNNAGDTGLVLMAEEGVTGYDEFSHLALGPLLVVLHSGSNLNLTASNDGELAMSGRTVSASTADGSDITFSNGLLLVNAPVKIELATPTLDLKDAGGIVSSIRFTRAGTNSFIGRLTCTNDISPYNQAWGISAMQDNDAGYQNLAIGTLALRRNVAGMENVVLGSLAALFDTNMVYSVYVGSTAGFYATNANSNVMVGSAANGNGAGGGGTTFSCGIGSTALNFADGYEDTAVGYASLGGAIAIHNGVTAVGSVSGGAATNINFATLMGYYVGSAAENSYYSAFYGNMAGQHASNSPTSVMIGPWSGLEAHTATNSIYIGSLSGYWLTQPDKLVIDSNPAYCSNANAHTTALIGGDMVKRELYLNATNFVAVPMGTPVIWSSTPNTPIGGNWRRTTYIDANNVTNLADQFYNGSIWTNASMVTPP